MYAYTLHKLSFGIETVPEFTISFKCVLFVLELHSDGNTYMTPLHMTIYTMTV